MLHYVKMVFDQQTGSVAILAIFAMTLLSVLGVAFISLSSTEMKTSINFRDGVAAQCLADAGAKRVMYKLSQDPAWEPSPSPLVENLGTFPTNGRYEVSVAKSGGNRRTISSIGVVNKARRQMVLVVSVGAAPALPITVLSWNNY